MSMTRQDFRSRHFQQKILEFCELRISPIASRRALDNIRPYLINLIIDRKSPPVLNGRIDWITIRQACEIETELSPDLKKQLRPGLDAIIRWLGAPHKAGYAQQSKPTVRLNKTGPGRKPAVAS